MLGQRYTTFEGLSLQRLVDAVRSEFLNRPGYHQDAEGWKQVNSVRLVAVGVVDELSVEERLDVVGDLLRLNDDRILIRSHEAIFQASDAPETFITDLICEIVWQALMHDVEIRIEDEIRHALAGS